MQVHLKQNEIEQALRSYLKEQGIAGNPSEITFTSSRKGSGITADVEVNASGVSRPTEVMPDSDAAEGPIHESEERPEAPQASAPLEEDVEPEQEEEADQPDNAGPLFGT